MEELFVKSWEELQSALFRNSWEDRLQRFRSSYVYRGQSDKNYILKTSLMRLGGPYPALEKHLLRNFRKYAHGKTKIGNTTWDWLALAQHHGLPTRLLDWSYSPYVALHFATADPAQYHLEGSIWCVNYVASNTFLPTEMRKVIEEEGSNIFTAEMLDSVCKNLNELEALQADPFLVFLEPPSLDDRIINQYAVFSLLSRSTIAFDEWILDKPELFFKIIIPAELKWEIRDKLDQANITERVLFPGMDGLSRWLTRHYSPRFIPPVI